jgi:hypothetical protein
MVWFIKDCNLIPGVGRHFCFSKGAQPASYPMGSVFFFTLGIEWPLGEANHLPLVPRLQNAGSYTATLQCDYGIVHRDCT